MHHSIRLISIIVALAAYVPVVCARDGSADKHDLLLFLDAKAFHSTSGVRPGKFGSVNANAVYSYNGDRFRVLGEYVLGTEEQELERLLLGWDVSDNTTVWLGRFHVPDNIWNTAFHHGQFLQTSISRPWVEKFEDDGGALNSHSTGLFVEHRTELPGERGLAVRFGYGAGAHLEQELEPFDLLNPGHEHRATAQISVAYTPSIDGENQIGLFGSYNKVYANLPSTSAGFGIDELRQNLVGGYLDWRWKTRRIIASLKKIDSESTEGRFFKENFWGSFLFVEQSLAREFTVYTRWDRNSGTEYLSFLKQSLDDQYVFGFRKEISDSQAVTLEYAKRGGSESEADGLLTLQWSAIFPR